ncbi:hypothetical protein Tco_0211796 [Tanacetum coccineum]
MSTSKMIVYALHVEKDLIIEVVQFLNNNIVGNFNYPMNVLAYKDLCKYLQNYFLKEAFTKTPSVVYQNYLKELWCTDVFDLSKPPTDDSEPRPFKESIIRFVVKNGKTPLFFNFQTFVQTTRLYYNNGEYVTLPQTEVMKAQLLKLGLHNEKNVEESTSVFVNKTRPIQNMVSYSLEDPDDFCHSDSEGNKQPADIGLPSTSEDGTRKSKLLPEGKLTDPKDLEGNIHPADIGLPTTNLNEGIHTSSLLLEGTPTNP